MGKIFVVSVVSQKLSTIINNIAIEIDDIESSFIDLFELVKLKPQCNEILKYSYDDIEKISITEQHSWTTSIEVSPEMTLNTCVDLNCKYIRFYVTNKDTILQTCGSDPQAQIPNRPNAFAIMISAQNEYTLPSKPVGEKLSGPQRLLFDIITWIEHFDKGWTKDVLETGNIVCKKFANALWYIDQCHKKMENNGCPVPQALEQFHGYSDYKKNHHVPPTITSEKLNEHCMELTKCLSFPSMTTLQHKVLAKHIESLLQCLTKYKERLEKDNFRHQTLYHARSEPARSTESDSTLKLIHETCDVNDIYGELDKEVKNANEYTVIPLINFEPQDRIERRKYIKGLKLSKPITLFRMAYGGGLGTLNFIWTVDVEDPCEMTQKNNKLIAEISKDLPKFSNRTMRRDFINRYSSYIRAPKSILRYMYHELTNTEQMTENEEQRLINERVTQILLNGDDPQLLLDYRSLNGKNVDTKFNIFFEELNKYFDEQLLAVHERRHGDELFLPLAISVEDLKNEIKKRLPNDENIPIPSSELIRLQFMPTNPLHRTSLKYTGRFNVKYKVQTRQARLNHPDARYVGCLFRYLKEFCVKNRTDTYFVCLDDKAIVPVGEPGVPVATGVRAHNKALAPASGHQLTALDHDFHVAGLVPSVTLVTNIPTDANDSFYDGEVYVTTKDKVFQPSSPFRHSTDLTRILQDNYAINEGDLAVPILCVMTDGGPDHRVTYETVKASLVHVFMNLDLDFLIAVRTAPNHSWANPAERVMSILNLALQHCALDRNEMPEKFEKMVKNKSSLNAIRNTATIRAGLKDAYESSIKPVIDLVNGRFERMKFKGKSLRVYDGVPTEVIDRSVEFLAESIGASNDRLNQNASSKELRECKELQAFISRHCKSSHYIFQIKKCMGEEPCSYCIKYPPNLEDEVIEGLNFLPCPVPADGNQQYKSFEELYGQAYDDSHRPSASVVTEYEAEAMEADKRNKDLLKAGKARDAISCSECNKPRVIYSSNRLNDEQDAVLRRLREESTYICGDAMPEECGMITRESLHCSSEIETTYYGSTVRSFLPPCCVYCGNLENLMESSDDYISQLLQEYSVVRPLCVQCREKGCEAKLWGRKFVKKAKK